MENDVKDTENLEQAKQKLELEKQKQELIFLGIILVLLFMLYPILSILTYNEPSQAIKTAHTKTILEILPDLISDLIKNNLDSHQQEISDLLSSSKDKMYSKMDAQIDNLFDPIEKNVDKFLDWHYSLKGNYIELALLAAKMIGSNAEDALFNKLQEKLLGADYKQRLKTMTDNISDVYISLLRQHKKDTEKIATQGVADIPQVAESLKNINDRTERDLKLKMGFAAAIGATAGLSGLFIVGKLTPKLVAKIGAKLGAKLGAKFLAKFGTAVSGSLTCGPFAPACFLGVWFGSDAVINFIDERLHRDEFKKEILNNINEVKENLKNSYKQQFNDSFVKISQELQESYKKTQVLEKKTVKECIDKGCIDKGCIDDLK